MTAATAETVAAAGGRVAVGGRPAAARSGRQGAEGVAMSTTAVATTPAEAHINMVEAAAVAPEAAENTPEEAAMLEEAATATKQCQLLHSSS
jgi:hypothetical protein